MMSKDLETGASRAAQGTRGSDAIPAAQVPAAGELNVDHVAHFVPDIDAASAALERLGFTLTPFSAQSHRLEPGGPLVPAGTGNRCVMLERGYLEFLTPTGDTPVAEQLRVALRRYVGVHLIAFGTAAPDADHARLVAQGFEPISVALQRPIGTENGEGMARFTVVRVPPGTMAEGRIQYCQQQTPTLVWQPRWWRHRNAATALATVLVCVADPDEAAQRYARFTGLQVTQTGSTRTLSTARGDLVFADASTLERTLGVVAPAVPWIAGYALESRDLDATRELVDAAGFAVRELADERWMVTLPQALGGILIFQRPGAASPISDILTK
jgi:hypothetical protein